MDGEYTNCNTTGLGAHVSTDRSIKDVPQAPVNGSTSPVNVLSMATVRTDTSSSNKAPRRLPQRKSIVPRRDNDDDFHQPTRAIEATISPKSLKVTEQDASTNGKFSYTPFENEQQQVVRRKPGQTAACDVADIKVEFVGTRRTHASADTSVALDEMLNADDAMNAVEKSTRTLSGLESDSLQPTLSVDTDDSAIFTNQPFRCGNIHFEHATADLGNNVRYYHKKHFMCIDHETYLPSVTEFMANLWGLRNPNIVLSVISSQGLGSPWKSQHARDDFQKGIIKAMNTTKMWILTDGSDVGLSKLIGEAVREYIMEHQNSLVVKNQYLSSEERRKRRPVVIGVVDRKCLPEGVQLDGLETEGLSHEKASSVIHELNPDHTHFIILDDGDRDGNADCLRFRLEAHFRRKYGMQRRNVRLMSITGDDHYPPEKVEQKYDPYMLDKIVPVVGLLVQGDPLDMEHVSFFIKNKMPVLVLKNSGGIADLIGHTFEELQAKSEADPVYEETILRSDLLKMIGRLFPHDFHDDEAYKLQLSDSVIKCVQAATEGDSSYITLVNTNDTDGEKLRDLDKFLLKALLKAEKRDGVGLPEQLQNDLQLTIDWNRPDIAAEIFQQDFCRAQIDKNMFEKALLQNNREGFIDLFLAQGVRVHKYLNHKKLKLLFEKADDKEFFVSVCLEGVLGIIWSPSRPLGPKFLSEQLDRLLLRLTLLEKFIRPDELTANSTGTYTENATAAERKALDCLLVWAVLMNRHKLAKTLWRRCSEPVAMALVCSRMYKEMERYHVEQYQRKELEDNSREFADMALGALEICWRDASAQAFHMLGRKLSDFDKKTVVELAHDAGAIYFLGHPCCQRWLTKRFFGALHIKELDWGLYRLPYWFKILTSVVLIFPMYIWIRFSPSVKDSVDEDDMFVDDADDYDDDEVEDLAMSNRKKSRKNIGSKLRAALKKGIQSETPFYEKYYLLCTAPITKFWTTQIFYFMFLGLFSLATLWPTCGNRLLDGIVWFWVLMIHIELVWRTYRKRQKFKTISLLWSYVDIGLITFFLIILGLRIVRLYSGSSDYTEAKEFNCYALIYFYYRLLGVYLPISPTLGPMLIRIQRMITQDFVVFVRMFLIFMIVGGVTIQAIIYPHWPLNGELLKRIITRPIYAMWLTQVSDLDGDPRCSPDYERTLSYCHVGHNYSTSQEGYMDIKRLEQCPYSSFSGYIVTLKYVMICKLILVTLLFAMFSLTNAQVNTIASDIWKFQRYVLIEDFVERLTLPPPLTVFNVLFILMKNIVRKWTASVKKCCKKTKNEHSSPCAADGPWDDAGFWRKVVQEYTAREDAKADKDAKANRLDDVLTLIQEDLRRQQKDNKRLNDRMLEIERLIKAQATGQGSSD